jgi:hypothetical protein
MLSERPWTPNSIAPILHSIPSDITAMSGYWCIAARIWTGDPAYWVMHLQRRLVEARQRFACAHSLHHRCRNCVSGAVGCGVIRFIESKESVAQAVAEGQGDCQAAWGQVSAEVKM